MVYCICYYSVYLRGGEKMWYIELVDGVGYVVKSRYDYELIYGVYDTYNDAMQAIKEAMVDD